MTDWDGPDPSDSGVSRRALLAGVGGAALLGGGAVAFGPDITGGTEELATVSGELLVRERLQIDVGVPLKATATINTPSGETPDVGVEVIDLTADQAIISELDTGSVSARGTTESSGPHRLVVGGGGNVEGTLYRRNSGLF